MSAVALPQLGCLKGNTLRQQSCTSRQQHTSSPGSCRKGSFTVGAGAGCTAALPGAASLPTVSAVDAAPPRTPRVVEYTRAQLGLLLLAAVEVVAFDRNMPTRPILLSALPAIIAGTIVMEGVRFAGAELWLPSRSQPQERL